MPEMAKTIKAMINKETKLEQLKLDTIEGIQFQINETIQEHCISGDITPGQTVQLEKLTENLSELVMEIVIQNI